MLPRIEAEEQLAALNASAYPHMERQEARAYARRVEAEAGIQAIVLKPTRAALESIGITTKQEEVPDV